MNKTPNSPRKVYSRYGIVHTYLSGRCYGASELMSKVNLALPVKLEPMPSDGGRARVRVIQSVPGKKTLEETWRTCSVPRYSRK